MRVNLEIYEKNQILKWFIHKSLENFFSIWFFLHKHSRFRGEQGKWEGISLTPLYHFCRFTDTYPGEYCRKMTPSHS